MYTVYVLRDMKGKFYKGMTSDISRRLDEHKKGYTKTTRYMDGLSVVYSEQFPDFESARQRELYFKSAAGRRFLKTKLL